MKELSVKYVRTLDHYICMECKKKVKGIYLIRKANDSKYQNSIWICPYCFTKLIKGLWS